MTTEALKAVEAGMTALGLNYAFLRWKDKTKYPYFTGEYQEAAKEKIENYFYRDGRTAIASNGNAVVVSYSNSFVIPSGDAELKKIEIHLSVKEWKVT